MVTPSEPPSFFTPREFAAQIRSSKQHVLNLINAGRLPAYRPSPRKILIPRSALDIMADAALASLAPEVRSRVVNSARSAREGALR